MEKTPVIIIDLDNTIVGNVVYQMLAHNLCECLKKNGMKTTNSNKKIGEFYKKRHFLVRPYFCEFMRIVRERFPHIHIFVYTASDKAWATKEIQWIEKQCKVSINRPIFTRNDCVNSDGRIQKSINHILPRLKKATKNQIDLNNILIIDNNNVFMDCLESFVRCPDYNFVLFDDLWRYIPKESTENSEVSSYIASYTRQGYMNPIPSYVLETIGKFELKHGHHSWGKSVCKRISESNQACMKDLFWYRLVKMLETKRYNCLREFVNDIRKRQKASSSS